MPKFVRLKSKVTGAEFTLSDDVELGNDVEVIDKPAVNGEGVPLAPKHKTHLAPAPAVASNEPTHMKADTKAAPTKNKE